MTVSFDFKEQSTKKNSLLSVSDLSVFHDGRLTAGPISLEVRAGDRVLIKGDNGSGKTSLLRAIVGNEVDFTGVVKRNQDIKTIYIDQDQSLPLPNEPALENLQQLAQSLELHEVVNLLVRFNISKEVLHTTKAKNLSGGERAKVLLAAIAANKTNLLILDEPTNNLDIPTIEAFERALREYKGGVLLVSHDREFIDNLDINHMILI